MKTTTQYRAAVAEITKLIEVTTDEIVIEHLNAAKSHIVIKLAEQMLWEIEQAAKRTTV